MSDEQRDSRKDHSTIDAVHAVVALTQNAQTTTPRRKGLFELRQMLQHARRAPNRVQTPCISHARHG